MPSLYELRLYKNENKKIKKVVDVAKKYVIISNVHASGCSCSIKNNPISRVTRKGLKGGRV